MRQLQVYEKDRPVLIIEKPTKSDIEERIAQLDGRQFLGLALEMPVGWLNVDSSPSGRMHIHFSDELDQSGWLLDKSERDDVYVEFVLNNGQRDEWAMCETVSLEVAAEVACFLLQHNTLPKGLDWEGHMWRFE